MATNIQKGSKVRFVDNTFGDKDVHIGDVGIVLSATPCYDSDYSFFEVKLPNDKHVNVQGFDIEKISSKEYKESISKERKETTTDQTIQAMRDALPSIVDEASALALAIDEKFSADELNVRINALLKAILDSGVTTNHVKLCAHCGRPFLSANNIDQYCTGVDENGVKCTEFKPKPTPPVDPTKWHRNAKVKK